jgi:hypothetical protein
LAGGCPHEIQANTLPFSEKLPTIRLPFLPVSDPHDHPDSPDSTDEASPREKPMGFWEHLEELRGVIIKSVLVFIVGATLVGFWMTEFNEHPVAAVEVGPGEASGDIV